MPGPGDVIAGKYRLDRLVGSGGMGVVYAATHVPLSQPVAVKFVRSDPGERSAAVRLVREARAVALLSSDYVARVQDVGTLDDGSPFLVMELLEGYTLHALLKQEGPLAIERVCEYAIHVCHALGDAHAHGIIHRDIKPSNLFLAQDGSGYPRVKVIDFGISKAQQAMVDAMGTETRTGMLLGSPPFMSPEQIHAAARVDGRSDLWSLAITLHVLMSGKPPFEAGSLLDLMTLIAYEPPPSLRALRPDVPEALENVILRCLAKKREDRFPSAAELAEALAPFAPERARWIAQRITRDVASPEADALEASAPDPSARTRPQPQGTSQITALATAGPTLTEVGTTDGVASGPQMRPRRTLLGALLGTMTAIVVVGGLVSVFHRASPDAGARSGAESANPAVAPPAPPAASAVPAVSATEAVALSPLPAPRVPSATASARAKSVRPTSRPPVRAPRSSTPTPNVTMPTTPD